MRYGIFSDMHSNLEAFESAIKAMKGDGIDTYICAGDIVGYGADPSSCIQMTRDLTLNVVCGNHDRASAGLFDDSRFNDYAREAVRWTIGAIGENERTYLGNLKVIYEGEDFTTVHGSLDEPDRFHYILDLYSATKTFSAMRKKLCFVGHSHSPVVFTKSGDDISYSRPPKLKLDKGSSYIVNIGSVGQPRDGDPRACYTIYDSEEGSVEMKRIAYDVRKAQEKILKRRLPPYLAWRLGSGQ